MVNPIEGSSPSSSVMKEKMGKMSSSESRWAEVALYNSGVYWNSYLTKSYSKREAFVLMCGKARQEGAGGFLRGHVQWLKDKHIMREE